MVYDLEHRVGILEATIRSEAEQRAKMSQDIGKLDEKVDAHFNAQRLLIQALQQTQSDHTEVLRDIRGKVDRMAPKVDLIETSVAGVSTRMGILEGSVAGVSTRMGILEGSVAGVSTRMGILEGRMEELDGKFERLDGKMDAVIDMLRNGR
jgi:chromosome segregation ATPase